MPYSAIGGDGNGPLTEAGVAGYMNVGSVRYREASTRSSMECGMPKASLEELKGQIAAGQYAIDPGILAGDILSKVALVRRVRRLLMGEGERGAETEAERGLNAPRQRGSMPGTWRFPQPRSDRLQ